MAQWAKRPPLKLEVPGSNPRGWFNGRAGNRDPFRWLETARGLEPIRLIGRAQCSPGDWPLPRYKGCPNVSFRCLSDKITVFVFQLLYLARRANWTLQLKVFDINRQAERRFLIGLSFPSRRELLQLPGQNDRRKQLQKWRLAAQQLSAAAA